MFYRGYRKTFGYTNFKATCTFGNDIKSGVITMNRANNEQNPLAKEIKAFNRKTKPSNPNTKKEK